MYILTLQFDFTRQTGRFSGDAEPPPPPPDRPLSTSMNWLRLDTTVPGVVEPDFVIPFTFNIETAPWIDLEEAGTLVIPKPDPQVIGIYVRQDRDAGTGPALDTAATASLAVCFGRPSRARQTQASPITDTGTAAGTVKTTFMFPHTPRNSPPTAAPGTGAGWFFPLGKIAKRPNNKILLHRYEFAIGLEVHDVTNNIKRYYGEDPEMDIGES